MAVPRVNETALRIALGVVSVAGLAVAGYLTMVRLEGDSPSCIVGGGCKTVQESEYSELAGIPVAVLGLLAYVGLLAAALLPGPLGRALGLFVGLVASASRCGSRTPSSSSSRRSAPGASRAPCWSRWR